MSNIALILAGGVGQRMGADVPKQYLVVNDKPILVYTLERFQRCEDIHKIVVVADTVWRDTICDWVREYGIAKFASFADPGATRQDSIYSGLTTCKECADSDKDVVAIHDAARALVSPKLITTLIQNLAGYDGCVPALPLKDAVFYSENGDAIDHLLDKTKVFVTQCPECFYLQSAWELNHRATPQERAVATSNYSMGVLAGWNIRICPGDENCFKITTPADLDRMASLLQAGKA